MMGVESRDADSADHSLSDTVIGAVNLLSALDVRAQRYNSGIFPCTFLLYSHSWEKLHADCMADAIRHCVCASAVYMHILPRNVSLLLQYLE